jgi:mannan endo-1,6-alpha-mannosidase
MHQSSGSEAQKWRERVDGLITGLFRTFFPTKLYDAPASPDIMVEIQCEPNRNCNTDQASFKAYTFRWLAVTAQLCPWTKDRIMQKIRGSAAGAAQQCSGGDGGTWCGQNWNSDVWDGHNGAGEQMSALSVIMATMIDSVPLPVTASTGGISVGDPLAGIDTRGNLKLPKIQTADKVGAAILTVMIIAAMLSGCWFMIQDP